MAEKPKTIFVNSIITIYTEILHIKLHRRLLVRSCQPVHAGNRASWIILLNLFRRSSLTFSAGVVIQQNPSLRRSLCNMSTHVIKFGKHVEKLLIFFRWLLPSEWNEVCEMCAPIIAHFKVLECTISILWKVRGNWKCDCSVEKRRFFFAAKSIFTYLLTAWLTN